MAVEWMDGFEVGGAIHGGASRYNGFANGNTWVTGRNGVGSAIALNGASFYKNLPSAATKILGGAFRPNVAQELVSLMEGATVHINLGINSSGQLTVKRNTTLLATGTTVFPFNTWIAWEMKATIHDSTGAIEVRVQGLPTAEINISGVDTRNGGTLGEIDRVTWGGGYSEHDDIRVISITGDAPTDFIGDCKVETLLPNGAGASTQFTPSAGSNWQNVDEPQASSPDDDTSYNASSTVGHIDLYALPSLVTTEDQVHAVQVTSRWRKDDAGVRKARRVIRSGGSNFEGSYVVLGDSYSTLVERFDEDPNTSAPWTLAAVNAMEIGVKVQE